MTEPTCPLCDSSHTTRFCIAPENLGGRRFRLCGRCRLVFVEASDRLDRDGEYRRYLQHENDPEDPGYREFLRPLWEALKPRLESGARGLDYGAGPGPALARMIEEDGHRMKLYDPFFHPDPSVLERRYDFVTCSETAEHFRRPDREFRRLDGLLVPGGWLGVMTSLYRRLDRFPDWHYARDPTHVCFYAAETMEWIAVRRGWDLWVEAVESSDVVLFRKPAAAGKVGIEAESDIGSGANGRLGP